MKWAVAICLASAVQFARAAGDWHLGTVTFTTTETDTTFVLPKTPQYFTTSTLSTTSTATSFSTVTSGTTTVYVTSTIPAAFTITEYPPAGFTPIQSALPLASSIATASPAKRAVNSAADADHFPPPPPFLSFTTTTITTLTTATYPTATIIVSTTETIVTTLQTQTTVPSVTVTSTVEVQQPLATYYAACGPDNQANRYNDSAINSVSFYGVGGQYYVYDNITSMYDCCALCVSNINCMGADLRTGGTCFTLAGGDTCDGGSNTTGFGIYQAPEGNCDVISTLSNGYCGQAFHDPTADGYFGVGCPSPQ